MIHSASPQSRPVVTLFWSILKLDRRTDRRTSCLNIVITTGQDCGRPRGSKSECDLFLMPKLEDNRRTLILLKRNCFEFLNPWNVTSSHVVFFLFLLILLLLWTYISNSLVEGCITKRPVTCQLDTIVANLEACSMWPNILIFLNNKTERDWQYILPL